MWGVLTRTGGSEDDSGTLVPKTISLNDKECFVGRFAEPGDAKFTHKTQTKIDCPFVSSTHFSIARGDPVGGSRSLTIHDHSRNGTYVNGVLVGLGKSAGIQNGAEITLMYKNKVRIGYRLTLMDQGGDSKVPLASPVGAKNAMPAVQSEEDIGRIASLKSQQAESVTDNLNKQITVLQEEAKQLELRVQQQTARAETTTLELERANAKYAAQEKVLLQRQNEKAELAERLATAESHAAAIEARSCKLSEQLEEVKAELKEVRVRNATLSEDLNSKSAQLEARNSLMQTSNKTMVNEKSKWTKLEAKHEAACSALATAKEKIAHFTLVNQTLQDIVSDRDAELNKLRGQNDKLFDMVAAGRAAVERREAEVRGLHGMFSKAIAELAGIEKESAVMLKDSDYFEEIASGVVDLKWVGSQMPGNQETYIELFSAADAPSTAVNGGADSGAHSPASSASEMGSQSSSDRSDAEEEGEIKEAAAVAGSPAAGSKRKRSQTSAEEDGKDGKIQLTAAEAAPGAATEPQVTDLRSGDDQQQGENGGDAMDEEDDEDMQRTQAQATFAHLFEGISQRSRADSDSTAEVDHGVAMDQDSRGAAPEASSVPVASVAVADASPSAAVQQKIQAIRARAASTPATPAAPATMHQRSSSHSDAVSSLGASGSASAPGASLAVDLRSEDGHDGQDRSPGGARYLSASAPEGEKGAFPDRVAAASMSAPAGSESLVSKPNGASSQLHEVIEL